MRSINNMDIKISTYDFFNKFILGLVFVGVAILAFVDVNNSFFRSLQEIKENGILVTVFSVSALAIVYEVGIIINRLGSLLEELLRKCHWIYFVEDYKKYNDKKKEYPILNVLSREYALSRNSIVLFFLISIVVFTRFAWYGLIPLAIMILFYISCRKYSKKIVDLME